MEKDFNVIRVSQITRQLLNIIKAKENLRSHDDVVRKLAEDYDTRPQRESSRADER